MCSMEALYDPETGLLRAGDLAVSTSLTEDLIATAYLRLKAEGLLPLIYYEGIPLLSEHLRRMAAPETICLGFFADRAKAKRKAGGVEFCGMAWVLQRELMGNGMTKAEVGFAFMRHTAHPEEKVALGKMMTQAFFDAYNVDILIGTQPVENKLALKFAERLGFTLSGPIKNYISWEGALSDVYVSSLTKADWRARQAAARPRYKSTFVNNKIERLEHEGQKLQGAVA